MGNSSSSLPYSIDKQIGAPHDHNGWSFHEGKSTKTNNNAEDSIVSVFVGKKPYLGKTPCSPLHQNKMLIEPAYHHFKNCKKLRHPQILKVYATLDTDNPNTATTSDGSSPTPNSTSEADLKIPSVMTGDLIIVTEPCIPLEQWLNLSNPKPTNEQLAWGLECIIRGLHFLHNSAKIVHGNIIPSSIYVTLSGDVKLWNFSLVTPIGSNGIGPNQHFQEWESIVTPDSYRSQERIERRYNDIISNNGVHCIDSYMLGILMDYWWSGLIPQQLQKATQRLLTTNIRMRPRLQPLLKCPIFITQYQKIQISLEEITIQPIEQKVILWQNLYTNLQSNIISKSCAIYKLLPLLRSSITTICTNEAMVSQDLYRREVLAMLPPLFFIYEQYYNINEINDEKIQKEIKIKINNELGPIIALLFVVKDRGVRGTLLGKVDYLVTILDSNILNVNVFEPLCSGFSDSSSVLRELTLKATLGLVPHLTTPNLEKLSRYLIRLQSDTETSIRTNTVIFISKLASQLTDTTKQKLLLPAFVRAMKDPFPPCRLASLQATVATKQFFTYNELATKVLPSVTPLLMDPISNVRNEAFQIVDTLLTSLRAESDRLAHAAVLQQQQQQQQQQQNGGNIATSAATTGTTTNTTSMSNTNTNTTPIAPSPASGSSYLSGLSSWVTSSSTTTTSTTPQPPPQQQQQTTQYMSSNGGGVGIGMSSSAIPTQQQQQPSMLHTTTTMTPSAPTPVVADDGWGDEDDDGWGDDDDNNNNNNTSNSGGMMMNTVTNNMAGLNTTTGGSSPFAPDLDDPFASIGMNTTSSTRKSGGGISGSSKLIVPKKNAVVIKAAAPATKLSMDDDDIGDGWDDF